MPRHGCLHRDRRTLEIPYFSYHHDIGILSEDSAQSSRIGIIRLVIDLTLDDSWKFVFDRVFEGNNLFIRSIQTLEDRIEGRGLSTSCRSRDEDGPIFLLQRPIHLTFRSPLEAEFFEFWDRGSRVKDTTYDILSIFHRKRRDSHIDTIIFKDTIFSILWDIREIQFQITFVLNSFEDQLILLLRKRDDRDE